MENRQGEAGQLLEYPLLIGKIRMEQGETHWSDRDFHHHGKQWFAQPEHLFDKPAARAKTSMVEPMTG